MHADLIAPRPLRLTAPAFAHHSHSTPASSLIRPQPAVRLVSAPPPDAFARIILPEDDDDDHSVDRDRPFPAYDDADSPMSPRDAASPRYVLSVLSPQIGAFVYFGSSLSPDALEEFLSILRPVMFNTPASPILRTRYERPHPYKPKTHRRTMSANSVASDDTRRTPERTTSRGASKSSNSEERDEVGEEIVFDPRPWPYSSFLCACILLSDSSWAHVDSFSASPISRIHTQNPLGRHVSHDPEVPFQSAYLIRAAPSPISSPAAFALAQSVPIPPSPPSQTLSRGSSPQAMDI